MTKTLWEYEAEFICLMERIKRNGIRVDIPFSQEKFKLGIDKQNELLDTLGFNPSSSHDLERVLIDELGYPVVKRSKKTGRPSFDKFAMAEYEALMELDKKPLAGQILEYRGWSKTTSSNYKPYIEFADSQHLIHPEYKVHGTHTCRLSCSEPNLQQIPKSSDKPWNGDVRQAFIPRNDLINEIYEYLANGATVLISFDVAQLETRLVAAMCKEYELIEAFKQGIDVFQVIADSLSWTRNQAKTFVYATIYGAGMKRIALIFDVDEKAAFSVIQDFQKQYPKIRQMSDRAKKIAERQKYITYWTGRRRHLATKYHRAFNAIVQGGGFEIVKRAMLKAAKEIPYPMVLQVHDEVVFEIPKERATIEELTQIKTSLETLPDTIPMGVPFKWDWKPWIKNE